MIPSIRIPARSPQRLALIMAMIIALTATLLTARPAEAAPTVRDFEGDPVGTVPADCTTPAGRAAAQITDRRAFSGERALQLTDDSSSSQTVIICPAADGDGTDLRFAVYPESLRNGLLVSLLGTFVGKPDADRPVFQLMIKPDGAVFWFDGLGVDGLGWTQIGTAGTAEIGRWTELIMQVPEDHREVRLYTGDKPVKQSYIGAAGPVGVSPVASITAYQFATAGTATTGDTFLVDNIATDDGSDTRPAPQHPVFTIGEPTVIDRTDQGFMQMPNTAVTVSRPDGTREILVAYPVHGDATHDTGTALASSLDGGRTWTNADDRNPFPNEQSFYLSRLRNGDLLAVSYHTFMIENSGSLQAEVPTALSTDGGQTWTHRAGRMTAPEAMRPISTATSRPGHPLGGFVLVHRVVEDPNGTLYQSGYGYYKNDPRYRQIILASTDGGEHWTVRGTVAVNPDLSNHPRYEGFCEGAIVRTTDGNLLTIMRTGNYQSLYQSRSTDNGATWSTPEPVTAGPDDLPVVGVFPDLVLMGNGTLVLYVGRPGQSVLASTDGNGTAWTTSAMVDYLNSGNGTQLPIGRNRLLTFGDRGADWTPNTPTQKAVWATPITVRTGGPAR